MKASHKLRAYLHLVLSPWQKFQGEHGDLMIQCGRKKAGRIAAEARRARLTIVPGIAV